MLIPQLKADRAYHERKNLSSSGKRKRDDVSVSSLSLSYDNTKKMMTQKSNLVTSREAEHRTHDIQDLERCRAVYDGSERG